MIFPSHNSFSVTLLSLHQCGIGHWARAEAGVMRDEQIGKLDPWPSSNAPNGKENISMPIKYFKIREIKSHYI